MGEVAGVARLDVVVLILDATNLERNLYLASQVLELKVPTVVALNMTDLARRRGIAVKPDRLARRLGCPVVPIVARTREGVERLRYELETMIEMPQLSSPSEVRLGDASRSGCQHAVRYEWAQEVAGECVRGGSRAGVGTTEAIDRVLTHPGVGGGGRSWG